MSTLISIKIKQLKLLQNHDKEVTRSIIMLQINLVGKLWFYFERIHLNSEPNISLFYETGLGLINFFLVIERKKQHRHQRLSLQRWKNIFDVIVTTVKDKPTASQRLGEKTTEKNVKCFATYFKYRTQF